MKRIDYLDNAKSGAILLMILGHCSIRESMPFCQGLIYSFHMPLFFLISGYFIKIIDVKASVVKFTNSCIRPYIGTLLLSSCVLAELKSDWGGYYLTLQREYFGVPHGSWTLLNTGMYHQPEHYGFC